MNLLAKGQALLLRLLARDASPAGSVVYVRKLGGLETDLTGSCWVGRTVFSRVPVEGGPAVVYSDRDFLVPVAALAGPPLEGDCLEEDIGETTPQVYRVTKFFDEPSHRYADPGQTVWRIHTQRVG